MTNDGTLPSPGRGAAVPLPRSEGDPPLLDVREVSYHAPEADGRPRRTLVDRASFRVEAGETLVLLGRSGSGKTTLLKLINRLLEPAAGEVRLQGQPTSAIDPTRLRRRIGYVIQEVGLFPHLTVERNVGLVLRLEGWSDERIAGRAADLLGMVGLDAAHYARRYPHELSGGERQRVGVARALAADPPLLLLDEPFGALDPITRAGMQREFRDLEGRLGKGVVFVTHDLREALLLATRIALLERGRLVFEGSPAEFQISDHAEVAAFRGAA